MDNQSAEKWTSPQRSVNGYHWTGTLPAGGGCEDPGEVGNARGIRISHAKGILVMMSLHEDYVVDGQGQKKAVVVPMREWERILEALEELDDIRAYDKAKSHSSDAVAFEQAVLEIHEGETE